MSKLQILRALVTERLTAAVEEIFALVERTITEYEEELCGFKEENQRKQQILDQVLLHGAEAPWTGAPFNCKVEQPDHSLSPRPQFSAASVKSEQCPEETREDNDEDWNTLAATSMEADGGHYTQVQMTDTSPATVGTGERGGDCGDGGGDCGDGEDCGGGDCGDGGFEGGVRAHGGGVRELACPFCSKTFVTEQSLKAHRLVHTGEKAHVCLLCGKTFTRLYSLHAHARTHTGERPFRCSTCDKSFARKYHLTVHQRLHAGERPFSCALCHRTFARKDQMQVHARTHSRKPHFYDTTAAAIL